MAKVRTKREIASLFQYLGLRARRSLGQNFLVDHNLLEFMVRAAEVGPEDLVLDIGCGTGLLTAHLAEAGGKVVGIEIDRGLFAICSRYLEKRRNVALVCGDALESKRKLSPALLEAVGREWATGGYRALRVVSNLAYCIASLVVPNLLESGLPIATMVVTVQKEVAERMAAGPDTRQYGALSVVVQAHAAAQVLRKVPPEVFWPRPNVESAIVRIVPKTSGVFSSEEKTPDVLAPIRDYALFTEVVRAAFLHRRKTLANALRTSGVFSSEEKTPDVLAAIGSSLAGCGIPAASRAEDVSVEQYIRLANALAQKTSGVFSSEKRLPMSSEPQES